MVCGSLGCGYLSDRARKRILKRTGAADIGPDHRVRLQVIGIAVFPVGALLYAWTGHFVIHAAGPIAGVSICKTLYFRLSSPDNNAQKVLSGCHGQCQRIPPT